MAQEGDEALSSQWRDRLKRQAESGLTIEAFCEKEGVSQSVFYVWKRQLQDSLPAPAPTAELIDAGPQRRKQRVKGRQRRQTEVAPASKPVCKQPGEFLRLPVPSMRSIPWIELTLVDGTVIRIPQENHTALSIVLKTLRSDSSGIAAEARDA